MRMKGSDPRLIQERDGFTIPRTWSSAWPWVMLTGSRELHVTNASLLSISGWMTEIKSK